jgi:hypothetical protein
VPEAWVNSAVKAAVRVAAGETTAGVLSASALTLADGAIWAMTISSGWKTAAAALAAVAVLTAGAGVVAGNGGKDKEGPRDAGPAKAELGADAVPPKAAPDARPADRPDGLLGFDATYTKGVAGLGYQQAIKLYGEAKTDAATVHRWSRRMADEEAEGPDLEAPIRAAQGHLSRMMSLIRMQPRGPLRHAPALELLDAQFYVGDAQRRLKAARESLARVTGKTAPGGADTSDYKLGTIAVAEEPPPVPANQRPNPEAPPADLGPGKDPRSKLVFGILDRSVAMKFPNETPLEYVIKYIKTATKSPEAPNGVAVYVDPVGLQEAEKTMTSPVQMDLEGVPLRRTLQLLLAQLGLFYTVEDGMIFITAQSSEQTPLEPSVRRPSPFVELQDKLRGGELSAEQTKAFLAMLKDRVEAERLFREMLDVSAVGDRARQLDSARKEVDWAKKVQETKALLELLKEHKEIEGLLRGDTDKQLKDAQKEFDRLQRKPGDNRPVGPSGGGGGGIQ